MSCPVCLNPVSTPALTGTDLLFESTRKEFTLHSCPSCRCLFMNPMPNEDEIAAFYPKQYWWTTSTKSSGNGTLKKFEAAYRKAVLRDHVAFILDDVDNRRDLDLLDVGCGSGTLLGLMKQRGFRPLGIDFSPEAAHVARTENDVRVLLGSLQQAKFAIGSF